MGPFYWCDKNSSSKMEFLFLISNFVFIKIIYALLKENNSGGTESTTPPTQFLYIFLPTIL